MAKTLPKWLSRAEDGSFIIDPNIAYPEILKHLGVDAKDVNQYWIESAFQCAKIAVQELVYGTELDPRPARALVIVVSGDVDRKEKWALKNYERGKGLQAATKGLEAKRHFSVIRNRLIG
jgi:hypothetical protein